MSVSAAAVRATVKALRDDSPVDGADAGTSKAVKTILNSRKCWRNMKGKEEAVWPPELEAALIEGLERYRPAEAKSNRVLGRFPMRNKFVADHIFETTGQRRTPKQVGSRIQQLRDTSSGKHILKAISDRHYEMMHPSGFKRNEQKAGPSRSHSGAVQQPSAYPMMPPAIPVPAQVYINVLPPRHGLYPPSFPLSGVHVQEPRPLHYIDPTVNFTLPGQMVCQAVFYIYKNGQLVQQEYAPMTVSCGLPSTDPVTSLPLYTYSTTLVPQHWASLCEVEDLSAYTICLQVVRIAIPGVNGGGSCVLLTTNYHFVDASPYTMPFNTPPPLSPHSISGEAELDFASLSAGSSPSPLMDNMTLRTPPLLGNNALVGLPELIFNFEDECPSVPNTPLDFPTTELIWSYPQPTTPSAPSTCSVASRSPLALSPLTLTEPQTLYTCDGPFMDPTAVHFDTFGYQ